MTSLVISDHVLLQRNQSQRSCSLWLVTQDRATINSGSPPSCDVTFWQWSVASPSEIGWLASKVYRYLSILCLWKALKGLISRQSVKRLRRCGVLMVSTARCYASVVLAIGLCLSVSVSVYLSVTSRSSTKTAKRRITWITPHDSPGTLVFGCQRSLRNSTGVTPYEGAECRWGGSKSATFDK